MVLALFIGVLVLVGLVLVIPWIARRYGLVTAAVAVIIALGFGLPMFLVRYYLSTYEDLDGFVGNITEAFGLPSELGKAGAVLLVVPAVTIAGMIMSLNKERRTTGIILLTVGIAVYWVLMWAGTRDHLVTASGERLKCYSINADGVRFFQQQQVDPRTGEMCEWVDQSNIHYVQAIDARLRQGGTAQRVHPSGSSEFAFFVTGTHAPVPLVWHVRNAEGFEFFDAPGFHPLLGRQLEPVTPEVVEEWLTFPNKKKKEKRKEKKEIGTGR